MREKKKFESNGDEENVDAMTPHRQNQFRFRGLVFVLLLVTMPHFMLALFGLPLPLGIVFGILSLCFSISINLRPTKQSKAMNARLRALIGGRQLILAGLLGFLAWGLCYWPIKHMLPTVMLLHGYEVTIDLILSAVYLAVFLTNGFLRILLLSWRLRVVRRIIVLILIWIPAANVVVLLYLCHIAFLEYDYARCKLAEAETRADSAICKTKYPLIMLHGVGFMDLKYFNYWGRIPKALIQNGATVYYGNQEAWGTIAGNAEDIKERVLEALSETGAAKVNIIAHSKGGLDARHMVSALGIGDRVASVTLISVPNHGCRILDIACRFPDVFLRTLARIVNWYYRRLGNKAPDFYTACHQFTTGYLAKFNAETPDAPGVYYQSYMSVMRQARSDLLLAFPFLIMKEKSEENDGLVTVGSAKWGVFRGIFRNEKRRGISHGDIIDLKREDYPGFDPVEAYVRIVADLKEMGY